MHDHTKCEASSDEWLKNHCYECGDEPSGPRNTDRGRRPGNTEGLTDEEIEEFQKNPDSHKWCFV